MEVKETAEKYMHHTYADYEKSNDDERFELIDGVVYMMSTPSQAHQEILLEMAVQFRDFLKSEPCKVLIAPFAVRLNAADNDDTVLEPDLLVVCDMSKLDGKSCVGAPDLVVEILSPSTSRKDRIIKLNKYLKAGVREYWIVSPEDKSITAHTLKNGEYVINGYASEETDAVAVHVLEGCMINVHDIFNGLENS